MCCYFQLAGFSVLIINVYIVKWQGVSLAGGVKGWGGGNEDLVVVFLHWYSI